MRHLALILALIAWPAAASDLIYTQGVVTVRLTQAPCRSELLATLLKGQDSVGEIRAAVVKVRTQRIGACWALDSDGDVLIIDQNGTDGFMPMDWFKPDEGVGV